MTEVDLSDLKDLFFEEAAENIGIFESTMLALEAAPQNQELLHRAFRAAHSIKGGAATFGFQDIANFTHKLEGLLDKLRGGVFVLTPELAGLLLRALDQVKALVEVARVGGDLPDVSEVLAALIAATNGSAPAGEVPALAAQTASSAGALATSVALQPPQVPAAAPTGIEVHDLAVHFTPAPDMLARGADPLLSLRELSEAGEVLETVLDEGRIPVLADLDPGVCYASFRVRLRTTRTERQVHDLFAFVEDMAEVHVEPWTERAAPSPAASRPARPVPPASKSAPIAVPAPAAATPVAPPPGAPKGAAPGAAAAPTGPSTLRVASEKIDRLIDLVGEIVISQSMLIEAMNASDVSERVREAALELERNTRELQERVMSVRMVPIGSVFGRFPRMMRDLSVKLGKKFNLVTDGEDTEIDKGAVEMIADPLTHVLRNALDHGIETPEERERAGKPAAGTVHLSASHQGGHVVVEVVDDGRGVDVERVRAKAIERGLIRADEKIEDDKVVDLLFMPGFSTASVVSDVSGRGVGMDVVKRGIEALGGSLQFSTVPGQGSSLRMKLPMTMAIMNGLSVRVGGQVFVLPIVSVVESFRPRRDQLNTPAGSGEVVRVRSEPLVLLRLSELLAVPGATTDPCAGLVCIVEAGASRVAFLVDELLGESQVVVKSMETNYGRVEGVMGATIMGDGRVAFILDPPGLVRRASALRSESGGRVSLREVA